MIAAFDPDGIHIATEGPLGFAARWYCKVEKRSIPHNTSYHTKFPEYLNEHIGLPVDWGYWCVRWFHKFSTRVLVTTESMRQELSARGFERLEVWNRGVDRRLFNQSRRCETETPRPILLCVSRASKEKGLDDFCQLETQGTKILVGDGPYLDELKKKYHHQVVFPGYKHGESLACYYANADVFVFPSRTDTFGVVMIEAMACGTPVAAYPVTGPVDVVKPGITGALNDDLATAVSDALLCDRAVVADSAEDWSWEHCTETFLANIPSAR
jgi:glycosyltransferase involved in cell wall biosynthesis